MFVLILKLGLVDRSLAAGRTGIYVAAAGGVMRLPSLVCVACCCCMALSLLLLLLHPVSALQSDQGSGRKQKLHPPRKLSAAQEQQLKVEQNPAKSGNAEVNLQDYYISDPIPRPFTPWRSGPVEHFKRPPDHHIQTNETNAP